MNSHEDFPLTATGNIKKSRHQADFKTFDRRELVKMDDKALSLWQSDFEQYEPQWRLAEHEWQRRITVEQIKAARWQAWFGIAAAIIGSLLTLVVQLLTR